MSVCGILTDPRPVARRPRRERDPVSLIPLPRMDVTLQLSTRTLNRMTERRLARLIVGSVWDTLTELERAGHHPGAITALRFVLIHHEPTRTGRCRACRRMSRRVLWRRRRFPCLVRREIRGELLVHLTINGWSATPGTEEH